MFAGKGVAALGVYNDPKRWFSNTTGPPPVRQTHTLLSSFLLLTPVLLKTKM
jgi:hypothetical protein